MQKVINKIQRGGVLIINDLQFFQNKTKFLVTSY